MNDKQSITTGFLRSVMASREIDATEKFILNMILLSKGRNFWEYETMAELLGTTRQNISKKMESLIDKGFLVRTKPPGKRYYLTFATDKAKKLFTPKKEVNSDIMALYNSVIGG